MKIAERFFHDLTSIDFIHILQVLSLNLMDNIRTIGFNSTLPVAFPFEKS